MWAAWMAWALYWRCPLASSPCDGCMERAAAGWYTSWRPASAGGWWRGRLLSLALPSAGVDPPAPADGATESGKCRSFIPRSLCTVASLLFYRPAHQNINSRDTVLQ